MNAFYLSTNDVNKLVITNLLLADNWTTLERNKTERNENQTERNENQTERNENQTERNETSLWQIQEKVEETF